MTVAEMILSFWPWACRRGRTPAFCSKRHTLHHRRKRL